MNQLKELFDKNRQWAEAIIKEQPDFFEQLSQQHAPEYLWIGCSDARVPSNQIVGLKPGELFVHRNVANVVIHTDLNCLSVIQYAVEVLKVKHVIVCGHYGCGGVKSAICNHKFGLIDNWLRHIQDVQNKHQELLSDLQDKTELHKYMCELNVLEQVVNVCQTTTLQDAWEREQTVSVHGWVYGLNDGHLRNLADSISNAEDMVPNYRAAVADIKTRVNASIKK